MLKYSSKSKQEILAISSLITRQFGRLHFNVSDADLSNSIKPIVSNPASSIPKASPPAPANNSIVRWTKSIDDIKKSWGNKYTYSEKDYFTFPDVSDFKNIYCDDVEEFECCSNLNNPGECINNLKSCGVGYRAPYMKKASEIFTLEMDLDDISKMSYDEAFDTMLKVPGVGPKVADCILLYGFNFRQAFPTDVWIKRIVSYLYFDGKDINVSKIREFGMEEFGDYAGYVQLYLFHYARMSGLMKKLKGI